MLCIPLFLSWLYLDPAAIWYSLPQLHKSGRLQHVQAIIQELTFFVLLL